VTATNQKPDNQRRLEIPARLREDLHGLFEPDSPVPAGIDRAILARAGRRFVRRRPRFRIIRLAAWAGSIAAAAAIFLIVSLDRPEKAVSPSVTRSVAGLVQASDIDRNGRVDILDAFKLARQIESTKEPEIQWDINRDGMVNRDDVDYVAFAAVRLDKGV